MPVLPADSQATMNKIEWVKEDKKLVEAEAKHIVVWNTKNTIAYLPETGALLFRGVTNEDSGEYHCLLTKQSTGETEDGVVRFYVQGKSNEKKGSQGLKRFSSSSVFAAFGSQVEPA